MSGDFWHKTRIYDFTLQYLYICVNIAGLLISVAALHQGAPGQMTWLEDPPPWLRPAYCFAFIIIIIIIT